MKFLRRFFTGKAGRNVTVRPAEPPLGGTLRARGIRWDVENEHDRLGDEQVAIWQADGIKAARDSRAAAAGATPLADGVRDVQPVRWRRIEAIEQAWAAASARLLTSAPSTKTENRRYWATYLILIAGDVFAVTAAGIVLGELPVVAFFQALASGAAAATAGLVASELRKRQMAHLFEVERPAEAEAASPSFTVFGLEPDDLMIRVAMAVTIAITVAIFLLRLVEGLAGALGFALLAFVSCCGSLINSWIHTRPGAEILDGLRQALAEAQTDYLELTGHEAVVREAQAVSTATSIEAEHAARGAAARRHLQALLWAVFRRHPSIFGHGVADGDQERREFHNASDGVSLGFNQVTSTPARAARIGRRAVRPVARDVHRQQDSDGAQ